MLEIANNYKSGLLRNGPGEYRKWKNLHILFINLSKIFSSPVQINKPKITLY